MGKVVKVESVDAFNTIEAASAGKLIVIDFFAEWCGPCKMIAPKIEAMSDEEEYANVVFLKIDVDNDSVTDLTKKFAINCMPTFIFQKDGKQIEKMEGANEQKLKDLVKQHK